MKQLKFPLTIAYNMKDKKVGCVLAQAAMGASFTGGDVTSFFEPEWWELNPSRCRLYNINNQEEMDMVIGITKSAHLKQDSKP